MFSKLPIAAGFLALVVVALLMSGGGSARTVSAGRCSDTDVTQWATADGGNGHWYQGVCGSRTWDEAVARAEAAEPDGHLATLTSAGENEFAFNLVDSDQFWIEDEGECLGPWLGGMQPDGSAEPDGGWSWVTGEPFDFEAWHEGEPNDFDAGEDRVAFWTFDCPGDNERSAQWNDSWHENAFNHLVEWDFLLVQGDFNCDGVIDEKDLMFLLGDLADIVDGSQSAPCPDLDEPEPLTGRGWGEVSCNDELDGMDAVFVLMHWAELETPPAAGQCYPMGAPIVTVPD